MIRSSHQRGLRGGRVALYLALVVLALAFAAPLFVMIATSFKTMAEIRQGSIFSLPGRIDLSAWVEAWSHACTGAYCNGLKPGFITSFEIVVPAVLGSVFLAAINGFALARWSLPHANKIAAVLLMGAFVPYQAMLYPIVHTMGLFDLYGTIGGLVIIHILLGQPILTMIFRTFYASLPHEIVQAARIDGAGFFRIFFQIILPLSPSILVVGAIMQTTAIWNDYLFGLVLGGTGNTPVTVLLNNIVNTETGEARYNVNMAATLLAGLPPLAVYFLSGRYFVRGIAAGAVKG